MLKKIISTLLVLMLVLQGGCQKQTNSNTSNVEVNSEEAVAEQQRFDEFIQNEFIESMEDDYLSTHVYFEHPENYGIDVSTMEVNLGTRADEDHLAENAEEITATLTELNSFDSALLTTEQQDTLDIYRSMLELSQALNDEKYQYMSSGFESMSGLHSQLPTLFADYVLRSEQDVEDLILLLADVKPYMESVIAYTHKQAELGYLMMDIDSVSEYCQKIVNEQENSAVLSSMLASVDKVAMDESKREALKTQLTDTFKSSFLAAYDEILTMCEELRSAENNQQGLAYLPNGKEYYELLFKNTLGTSKSIDEVKEMLNELAGSSLLEAQKIVFVDSEAYTKWANGEATTGYEDFNSMLVDLSSAIKADFPDVGTIDYEIKGLDEELANNGIAAYFNLPALDATTPKQIRVNMKEDALDMQSLSTYMTVAHEGLPGHMYQVSYEYQNLQNPFRNIVCGNLGYTEGYATYVEFYALNYLDGVDRNVRELERNMGIYQNCLIALIDIGIHYEGWTIDELASFMEEMGLSPESAELLYEQIQANPAAFLPYYVGYAEIAELKEKAQEALGDNFTDLGFHQALLEAGASTFDVLERHIDRYIEANQ